MGAWAWGTALVAAVASVWLWPQPGPQTAASPARSGRAGGQRPDRTDTGSRDGSGRAGEVATAEAVADALVLLALALQAGTGLGEALDAAAARCHGAVRTHLQVVSAARRWGRTDAEAWAYAPAVWRPAAHAWQVASAAGIAPAALVEQASARIREAEERRLEAATARAGVLLVLPLALCFLPAFASTAVVPVVIVLADTLLGP